MRKLCSKSVLRSLCCLLLTKNKNVLMILSSERNKPEFLRRYVTMNQTWIHHLTPESKRSSEWTATSEPRPKCPKAQQSAGKVMASVFWNVRGGCVIFIDYLEKGNTINSEYYIALLERHIRLLLARYEKQLQN